MKNLKFKLPYYLVIILTFYLLPFLTSSGVDEQTLMLSRLIPTICFITALIYGVINRFRLIYPIITVLLFIPTIFLYKYQLGFVYAIDFGMISLASVYLGSILTKVYKRITGRHETGPIKKYRIVSNVVLLFVVFVWFNNTSLFKDLSNKDTKFLAHRGLHQTFDISRVDWDTNTAEIIYEPEHGYLENTIASMEAAFEHGADVVELDIQLTKDRELAVFHDFTLEYRTDGKGKIADYTMEELKKLDIGYGYTADGGATYPFRGKGIGLMPSLQEVLERFPNQDLLIHIKDGNAEIGVVLWEKYLKHMTAEQRDRITIYGDEAPVEYLNEQSDTLRTMTFTSLKNGLIKYELLGWTGYVPEELANQELHIPLVYAKFLWGWPYKFIERMESVNTRVVIVSGNGRFSEGFDSVEELEHIPPNFPGYVWTNRMDRLSIKE